MPRSPDPARRSGRIRGAAFERMRVPVGDLEVVARRFPRRGGAPGGAPGRPAASGVQVPPTFVLVHGLGVSARYFGPLAAELAATGDVVAVDLPGYGSARSPRRDVPLAEHTTALGAALAALGVDRAVLVGHSTGAQVVTMLALTQPGLASSIALLAPTMQPDSRGFWRASAKLLTDALREPPRVVAIALVDYVVRCGLPYLLRQTPHVLADRLEDRMPLLDARVLVLDGERDAVVTDGWAAEVAWLARDGEFRSLPGAHVVMLTDPAPTARLIVEHATR